MRATLLAPLLLVGAFCVAALDADSGIPMWLQLEGDLGWTTQRVDSLTRANETLRAEIEALETDPFAIERAIREDLELARPGEVIVRFQRDPAERW